MLVIHIENVNVFFKKKSIFFLKVQTRPVMTDDMAVEYLEKLQHIQVSTFLLY